MGEEIEMDMYDLVFDHQYHGRNIKIEDGGRSAQKMKKGAKEALVVTNRQMTSNELFEVEVGGACGFKGVKGEMKAMLKGKESVRIGVTVHCPSDICAVNSQHSMKRMDTKTWMMMSESIVINGETVQSFHKYSLKEIVTGTRVGIMRVPEFSGSLLIYIDGAPIGIIATGVPEKVYGFVELQGDCEKVCLSPVRSIQHEALPLEIRSIRERDTEITKLRQEVAEKSKELKESTEQMETLRKQIVLLRESLSNGSSSISNGGIKGVKENRETQTSQPNSANASDCQSQSSTRRRKRGCTIL